MTTQKIEVRLSEKESANYFSNAAALYVLGVGFSYFAYRAQSPFMTGLCFWFSVFMLCDSFRLARVCARLDRTNNLAMTMDQNGITHNVSWLEPETKTWKEITGFRHVKTPMSETIYFQARQSPDQFLRFAFFGSPKLDLPVSCMPGGKEGLLEALAGFPAACHLVPERANNLEEVQKAAA